MVAGHGRHYQVETPEGRQIHVLPRGKKSEAVVGDRVVWMPTNATGDEGVLESIEPRRNLLYRQDEWRTKSFAANLDRLLVLVAAEPVFSESQMARALISAEQAGIEVLILLNKVDLIESAAAARERLLPYRAMGYEVLEVALKARGHTADVLDCDLIDQARALLGERLGQGATLVLGPSGTGKSTLVNLLVPQAAALTAEISTALNSGRHTTTHTRWYWLDGSRREAALIDSPGFQEFGLQHIQVTDLARWMPDLKAHLGHCRFHNCSHLHEPGCGVREALTRGEIAATRYRLYEAFHEELGRAAKW